MSIEVETEVVYAIGSMVKKLTALVVVGLLAGLAKPALAAEGAVLGVHVLEVDEVEAAAEAVDSQGEDWGFVTIPIRPDQTDKERWQRFFDKASERRLVPIVRLTSGIEDGAWKRPDRAEIVRMAEFLGGLDWKTTPRRVVVYNEPNHSGEWGGEVDPADYGDVLEFTADWLHTENSDFMVLPAGLDLAAGNTVKTMESFTFLRQMVAANPEVLDKLDGWTSHAYPNPGFSASAYRSGKNSVRGFESELAYLKANWGKDYQVYITETGWDQTQVPYSRLVDYYQHSIEEVWSNEKVVAVTPFVLNGFNGPFEGFSLKNSDGSPTPQLEALTEAKERIRKG